VLAARDPRIGVCLDIGWITAAGFDAAKVFREYNGRVFDMHLKDKKVEMSGDTPVVLDVEAGAGQANFKGLFEEIKKAGWSGVMAIETDNANFAKDPNKLVDIAADVFAAGTK
jgi:sugar phosphate isomerase/epimerase